MRVVTAWLLVALALISGTFALAEDEIELENLYINSPFEIDYLCTAEQALAFYDALEEYPALIADIADIARGMPLFRWYVRFASWYETVDQDCYGAASVAMRLERDARYLALQHFAGEEAESPEETAYARALEMSTADRDTLSVDEAASEYDLALNREAMITPLCPVDQAMAFNTTMVGFLAASSEIANISDEDSLEEWTFPFYDWSDENWAPLEKERCGLLTPTIAFMESFAYGAALAQLTPSGGVTLGLFDNTMERINGWITEEMDTLAAYLDE